MGNEQSNSAHLRWRSWLNRFDSVLAPHTIGSWPGIEVYKPRP